MSDIEELRALVNALHSRGIREKGLQRQIQKYMEIIPQVCTKHKDGKCLDSSAEEIISLKSLGSVFTLKACRYQNI